MYRYEHMYIRTSLSKELTLAVSHAQTHMYVHTYIHTYVHSQPPHHTCTHPHPHCTYIDVDIVSLCPLLVVDLNVVGPVGLQLDGLGDLARVHVEVGVGREDRRSGGRETGRDVLLLG